MAGEITARGTLTAAKGTAVNVSLDSGKLSINMSGTNANTYTLTVTTSEVALTKAGSIGTIGWMYVLNNDPTNFIKIRPGTGALDLCKLLPGEFALFRCAATAPYAIADTASCEATITMIEA